LPAVIRFTPVLALLLFAALPSRATTQVVPAPGQAAWRQDFEGPVNSWVEAGGDAASTVVAHQRVRGGAHGGQGSEWVQVAVQTGSTVYFAHDVGRPWVIEELRPALWVYSDRAGLQFLAEVTLPRTRDPRTGKPLTTNVSGSAYTTPNHWQQLAIVDFPRELLKQVHILRSQLSLNVDSREAYVSRVLLNVCGGVGVTNVWTDDLEVYGHVPSGGDSTVSLAPPPVAGGYPGPLAVSANGTTNNSPPGTTPLAVPPEPLRREVKLALSVLTVNGNPIFPRAVEYRGERLAFLKQLGFNTIWLRTVPTREFLWEARQLGLWLVSPPPEVSGEQAEGTIGPEFEPVLVWDLGHGLTGETLQTNRRRVDRVRLADSSFSRPLICAPANNLRNYSRQANMLLIDRRPLGTSLEMPNYGNWVRCQTLLALPGTPIWTTVQTELGEGLRRQLAALSPGQPPPTAVGFEQIRLLAYTAISAGSRGLLFLSDSSLEAQDDQTQQRATALHLVNLELSIVEPILAGGNWFAAIDRPSQALVSGAILRDNRARIALPMWLAAGSQCVAPEAAANPLLLTLPGLPVSSNIYELAGGRLESLRHNQEAGGTRVTLEEFGLSALLFIAEHPLIIDAVNHRAAAVGPQIARLERELAGKKLDTVLRVYGQIGGHGAPARGSGFNLAPELEAARQNLKLCDARLTSGDFSMASSSARRAMQPLRKLERVAWEAAMRGRLSGVLVPSFQALPWYWALSDRVSAMRPGANRLPGGDFENLDLMKSYGWRHVGNATPGIDPKADLVPDVRHGGLMALRLTVRPDQPENPPAAIETPPLWITSPATPVTAGQIVRIHGWVNVPTAISGSVDGLMVVESLTGEETALRIDQTAGWREFTMLRIVPESGSLYLTFVLTGLGKVHLDDVTIEVLEGN